MNFADRPDLLYKNPNEIVEVLEDENALADLNGINVVWYGLGSVEEPQKELSYTDLDNLKAIWSAILEACNRGRKNKTNRGHRLRCPQIFKAYKH